MNIVCWKEQAAKNTNLNLFARMPTPIYSRESRRENVRSIGHTSFGGKCRYTGTQRRMLLNVHKSYDD